MRKMREFSWQYVLFAVPAVVAAVGIQYLVRKSYPEANNAELSSLLKPSALRTDSSGRVPASSRLAKADKPDRSLLADRDEDEDGTGETKAAPRAKRAMRAENSDEDGAPVDAPAHVMAREIASEPEQALGQGAAGGACSSIEFRGEGMQHTKITKAEWARVMSEFHDVKDSLLSWLDAHRKEFPDKTASAMETQIRTLLIERPPAVEEPDLSWRGIAVWTHSDKSRPMIRLGGGFVKLVMKQPVRARFELARLVAQSWAPCELERVEAAGAWAPLLGCMGIKEDQACAAGTFSEGGWAVSSALAAKVADPGCAVPAFKDAKVAQCLKKIPLPLTLANSDNDAISTHAAAAQMEARK